MKILVIAPHPDDEVLGVAGTMAKKVEFGAEIYVCIVTKGYEPMFNQKLIETGRQEAMLAHDILGVKKTIFLDLPAAELDKVPMSHIINNLIEVIEEVRPDEVYIPHRGDIHMDHKLVADAAMVCLRPKHLHKVSRIYAYEVPSETGWDLPTQENAFIPTVYEDIGFWFKKKTEAMNVYRSQIDESPGARSIEAITSLAKYRGTTIHVNMAEAFMLIREIR